MVERKRLSISSWKEVQRCSVHSIVKKKRLKDEKLEREYPEEWSDFSLEVVDKTLVNMFEY